MPHIFKDLFSIINKENLNNSSIKIGIFSENQEFMNIHDYLQYFFPKYNLINENNDCTITNSDTPMIIYGDFDNKCLLALSLKFNTPLEKIYYSINGNEYVMNRLYFKSINLH